MEQQRALNQPENIIDDYNSLLPEIADLLNVTVSTLEHYPTDIKKLVCQTYINNYPLDKETTRAALCDAINLDRNILPTKQSDLINTDLPQVLQERKNEEHQQSAPCNGNKKIDNKAYLISRREILNNAKTISDSTSRKEIREKYTEQISNATTS